ncbi:MAG: alpha/beta fold hydrolase, partial [Candidatus Dormiibacterota bacterium]
MLDPADLGGALREVVTGELTHRPDRIVSTFADLSLRQSQAAVHGLRQLVGDGSTRPLAPGDPRFADRAWQENPFLRTLAQGYLELGDWALALVDRSGKPDEVRRRARFALRTMLDAASPTNLPWLNPAVIKEALDTGGRSLWLGLANVLDDLAHNGGRPRQVDTSPFEVGRNLAATPGRVVFRNRLVELIAYTPQTELVHAQPVLCSPPWINRYYIMDLAPDRSFIEYMVRNGFQVFALSYRNPDKSMAELTWDDYLRLGVLAGIDKVVALTGSPVVNLVGLCLGGTMAVLALAHLAARDQAARVGWATLTNTLVDFSVPGDLGAFTSLQSIDRLERRMRRRGYLDAESFQKTFDALRANDLIWSYVVNNWYMGRRPAAFDILAWNGHSTNLPATMHSQYLRACYVDNSLVRPGAFQIGGTPIDLRRIRVPMYVLSAVSDHITPWRGGYLTTQHVGGEVRYTLSHSGHIAGIVNPPGNPKAHYWTRERARRGTDADSWLAGAERRPGSWWEDWLAWAESRSGAKIAARPLPAGGEPAPGGYVVDLVRPPFDLVGASRARARARRTTGAAAPRAGSPA